MTSVIRDAILIAIEGNGGTFEGTEELALRLNAPKNWTIQLVRVLQKNGQLRIIQSPRGGRGHRTIYRSTTARKLRNERR